MFSKISSEIRGGFSGGNDNTWNYDLYGLTPQEIEIVEGKNG